MISIIIPAHNEEKVISRALREYADAVASGVLEVIVVCNGCSDRTAEIVASFVGIVCLDLEVPSKTNALNVGDAAASGFPRIYQDADVVLALDAVLKMARILESSGLLAVAPQMKMEYGGASWLVRAYYDVWQQLPYVKEGLIGVGVYALSREGRLRFDKFPTVIADDRYVRALFDEHERSVVTHCISLVRAPATVRALVKIKTRSRLGGYQFEKKFPELLENEKKNYGIAIWKSFERFKFKPALFIYLFINLWCRGRAWWQLKRHKVDVWERDETSRRK